MNMRQVHSLSLSAPHPRADKGGKETQENMFGTFSHKGGAD